MCKIPRIAGAAGETIVGLIRHQEFGCVGCAGNDGACGAQALDDGSGARRDFVCTKERTGGIRPAGNIKTAFDGDWDSVKRAERFVVSELIGCGASGGAGGFGIEMDECSEIWLERSDTREMGFEEFDGRELLRAKERGDVGDGREM